MHTVFALLCFMVVIHWLIFPYPSGLLHWHCGNLTIAPVPAKQPWWIWINTSCELIMNDCITTTKQSTTKPRAYFLGYTVRLRNESGCRNNICRADMNIDNLKMKTFQCCKTKVKVTGLQNVLHTERVVILSVPWILIWNASLKYRTYLWLCYYDNLIKFHFGFDHHPR